MLKENTIEDILRKYLSKKGWKLTNKKRNKGQHGWDIEAWYSRNRRRLLIECK